MLKHIYVDNYKCFVNFELSLQELTLLIGRNGAGKSCVSDVLSAIRKLLDGRAKVADHDAFPPSSLTRWQRRDVQSISIDAELDGVLYTYRLEVEHDRRMRKARIRLESLTGDGGPLFRFAQGDVQLYKNDHSEGPSFTSDWTESALARVGKTPTNTHLTRFVDFMRNMLVCGLIPPRFAPEAASEDQIMQRDGGNFVGWYRHVLQEHQHLSYNYTQEMTNVLDGLVGFRLEKVGIDTRMLVAVFGEGEDALEYGFHELSDGQRALIVLYALTTFSAHQGRLLLIDEPVNFVALSEVQPWLVALNEACGTTLAQAIVSSHNPEVIDYLGADRSVLLSRDGAGHSRAEPLADGVRNLTDDGPLRVSEVLARGWE